jgi:hypothetical protein
LLLADLPLQLLDPLTRGSQIGRDRGRRGGVTQFRTRLWRTTRTAQRRGTAHLQISPPFE